MSDQRRWRITPQVGGEQVEAVPASALAEAVEERDEAVELLREWREGKIGVGTATAIFLAAQEKP